MADATKNVDAIFLNMNAIFRALEVTVYGTLGLSETIEAKILTCFCIYCIAPDLDTERDLLLADLTKANRLLGTRWIDGFHKELQGRNGSGDPWHTDGRLPVATLK